MSWRDHIPCGAWPRLLPIEMAAAYLGMSRMSFHRLVALRLIDPGLKICASRPGQTDGALRRWDRLKHLDPFIDAVAAGRLTLPFDPAGFRTAGPGDGPEPSDDELLERLDHDPPHQRGEARPR